jgi:hypothetical protein
MIKMTTHDDPAFLILQVDHHHNAVIGTFQPARREDDLGTGVYVMETAHLGSLKAWARHQHIPILDDTSHTKGDPTPALHCGNVVDTFTAVDLRTKDNPTRGGKPGRTVEVLCEAPYPAGRVPKFCPECGQPANPIPLADIHGPTGGGAQCPGCGRINHGGGRFCLDCGTGLPDRRLTAPALPRTSGPPRPLGEAIAELGQRLDPPAPSKSLQEEA